MQEFPNAGPRNVLRSLGSAPPSSAHIFLAAAATSSKIRGNGYPVVGETEDGSPLETQHQSCRLRSLMALLGSISIWLIGWVRFFPKSFFIPPSRKGFDSPREEGLLMVLGIDFTKMIFRFIPSRIQKFVTQALSWDCSRFSWSHPQAGVLDYAAKPN